ncbi:MAG: FGGY family carbohydrate kinase [Cyclobacteriaceae bacterium]
MIAIFDIGKTNKKLFLFNESYEIVLEKSAHFDETVDEDGDPCEDMQSLQSFIRDGLKSVLDSRDFQVRAINCTSYGASFVYLDEEGNHIGPLYSYLKPYPPNLQKQFYDTYGGEKLFCFQTASPVLGNLNSGMQLYWLKYQKPDFFNRIKSALHLPQYLSYLLSGKTFSEITSIGCHTNLWHFQNNDYHYWVKREGILEKFPPIVPSDMVILPESSRYSHSIGIGLHDSSAALIPYLVSFKEPFVLISTGTWAISLNPFNQTPLTKEELECDCLCYMQYMGSPVKASRLFAGHDHDVQVERIASHFNQSKDRYYHIEFDQNLLSKIDTNFARQQTDARSIISTLPFALRELSAFHSDIEAYHQLLFDQVVQQHTSSQLIIRGTSVKRIFVDGGFSNNSVYMNLLAAFFPHMEVFASSIPQATAIGTALAIHEAWNAEPFPTNIIELKRFTPKMVITTT